MKNNSLFAILFFTIFASIVLFSCGGDDDPNPTPDPVDNPCSSPPTLSLTAENTGCAANTGKITATGAGGTGALTYQLGNGDFQSSAVFENLAAGEYTITVKDTENCTTNAKATVENADAPTISLASQNAGCDSDAGSITVTATGGSGNFEYSLDGGTFQSGATFSNLAAGTYTVSVKDSENCEATASATLTTGVNYTDNIASIINTNCAISGCHAGGQSPSLSNFNGVSGNASRVLSRAAARSMPPSSSGLSLTDAEIKLIECWVEDGAPQN
ncbi:hypothetical protein ACE193_22370 [Bernardetia sp. OM2101]|uniref:hypothetical protein n=1 Tax=Bernardetia sp. OM2101 TaxID=3344876 RepID=UPI0035D09D77